METICTEHHRKHHLTSAIAAAATKTLNIPPRKLLSCRKTDYIFGFDDDKVNKDSELDPYSSDEFRMYEFKIRKCNRSRSHDWTECPFVHPGEKARRRDIRCYNYTASLCSEYRRSGCCPRGDACESAHGVFEMWLHPTRYRTQACKDGKNCTRKVCFFAHSKSQLRISETSDEGYNRNLAKNHWCMHCSSLSPRSTLTATVSPPLSPSSPATMLGGSGHGSSWVDFYGECGGEDPFLLLSSSTPSRRTPVYLKTGSIQASGVGEYPFDASLCSSYSGSDSINGSGDPDLGWVDDLLM